MKNKILEMLKNHADKVSINEYDNGHIQISSDILMVSIFKYRNRSVIFGYIDQLDGSTFWIKDDLTDYSLKCFILNARASFNIRELA